MALVFLYHCTGDIITLTDILVEPVQFVFRLSMVPTDIYMYRYPTVRIYMHVAISTTSRLVQPVGCT